MTQPRPSSQGLTGEAYRRWCTLQNPAFIKAQREFVKRWQCEPDLFEHPIVVARKAERGRGLDAIREQQRRQGEFFSGLEKFLSDWPRITPNDVIGGASTLPGPTVRLALYSPVTWPGDGSLLLSIHLWATGDEVEIGFQRIKREIAPKKRERRKTSQKKVSIQSVNLEPGKESIILRVGSAATGKDAKGEFQRAKKAYWPRRMRKRTWRLKVEVYNLYRQGTGFQHMAWKLGISRPAVYDLLRAVCKDIGQETQGGKPAFDASSDWNSWEKHKPDCPSCGKGRFCRPWERKIGLPSANPLLSKLPLNDALDLRNLALQRWKRRPKIDY